MLTPFGVAIRKIRLDRSLRLLDLADKLDLTPSFVSAIETGTKPIPRDYVASVIKVLNLTPEEAKELQKAADQTKTIVNVDALGGAERELVAAFARRIDSVDSELLEQIKKELLQSISGEVPFQRKRRGIVVSPMSTKNIWAFADRVRSTFLNDDQVRFPIMEILEFHLHKFFNGFYFQVCDRDIMGDDEGRVVAGRNCIMLRGDVYKRACNGEGRDIFTACHEFGHFLLHREVKLARTCSTTDKIFYDSEWQADTFAGSLLMSARHLPKFADLDDAADQCYMTALVWQILE